jgi:AraC-like DNA-binding protein
VQLNAAPGLEGLAEQMNCSSRTLRRHLKDLGSSYQELLDELRFEQAKQMLCEDQLPIYRLPRPWVSARPRAFAMPSCAGVVWRRASSALDNV